MSIFITKFNKTKKLNKKLKGIWWENSKKKKK